MPVESPAAAHNRLPSFERTGILGWSVSRYDRFSGCKRQYYYDYYGAFDEDKDRIRRLKAMTSAALEAGITVHDVIKVLLERLLKSSKPVDRKRFIAYARELTDLYCSKGEFSEVYYRKVAAVDTEKIFKLVSQCLLNFLDSPRFTWIVDKALANKAEWVIEPPGFGETRIDGLKAYCKVDFMFPVDGKVYILDWKTGRRDDKKHSRQLLGYAAWAAAHTGCAAADIYPHIVYLNPRYEELARPFTAGDLAGFAVTVREETRQMYRFCQDVEQNIPLPRDEFPRTTREQMCAWCNYRELCR